MGRQQLIYRDKQGDTVCTVDTVHAVGRRTDIQKKTEYLVPGCERYPVRPAAEGSPLQTAGRRRHWNIEQIIQLHCPAQEICFIDVCQEKKHLPI